MTISRHPHSLQHVSGQRCMRSGCCHHHPQTIHGFRTAAGHYADLHTGPDGVQVPPGFHLQSGPLRLAGDVTSGFGRGSAQLGFPTANLPPEPLAEALAGLSAGVYFG